MGTGFLSPGQRERERACLHRQSELAQLERANLLAPIDIPALLGDRLLSNSATDWLLLVVSDRSADWPLQLMTSRTDTSCDLISDSNRTVEDRNVRARVRAMKGEYASTEIKGCSAVLLIISGNVPQTQSRLDPFTEMRTCPLVPLCVLQTHDSPVSLTHTPPCVGAVRETAVSRGLSWEGRRELERSLNWLAEHSEPTPKLHRQVLREYVADRMYSLCFKPAATHLAERERIGIPGPALSSYLSLYSGALQGVREELTGWRAREVNWPVAGDDLWDWNEEDQLSETCSGLDQLIVQPQTADMLIEECRHTTAECDSILTTNNLRQKRLGLPLSTPWGEILESVLNARMQSPRFDRVICSVDKSPIELPWEWTAALGDVINRNVSLAPNLRRKLNHTNRKRSTDVVQPIRDQSPDTGPARKAARLSLEKSLLRLEGLVTEELSQTDHITTLLQSQSDVTWQDQLAWVEDEIENLKTSSVYRISK